MWRAMTVLGRRKEGEGRRLGGLGQLGSKGEKKINLKIDFQI
jgi:hypothetical protein